MLRVSTFSRIVFTFILYLPLTTKQGFEQLLFMEEMLRNMLGVKFKDGKCAELCLKLSFENNWHFVILLNQMVFKIACPETKFKIITS